MNIKRARKDREYLGTIVTHSNYRDLLSAEGKDKIDFHKKHLKAYIQGKDSFYHGSTIPADITEKPRPILHYVEQSWSIRENKL